MEENIMEVDIMVEVIMVAEEAAVMEAEAEAAPAVEIKMSYEARARESNELYLHTRYGFLLY